MLTHNHLERGLKALEDHIHIDLPKAKTYIENHIKNYNQIELSAILDNMSYETFLKKLLYAIELDQLPVNVSKHDFESCKAPSITLYFDKTGEVFPCCVNRFYSYGNIKTSNLKEIIFGQKKKFLQEKLNEKNYGFGCSMCGNHILNGNIKSSHQYNYNKYNLKNNFLNIFPQIFEFEISNLCNLMCTMCGGEFSSSIRSKIDKLPPFEFVYTDKFLEEIAFFIPHLKACKFLGGEPFLIPFYYKIWEKIININPGCEIHITTNTTILNDRVKSVLDSDNVKLICSIDSLKKETYEKIRVNAKFDEVMSNLEYMLSRNKIVSFSVTPTVYNMYEIPEIINFCNIKNISIMLNFAHNYLKGAVHDYTKILFIHQLSADEIRKYIEFLRLEFNSSDLSFQHKTIFKNYIDLISKLDTNRIAVK
jgi:MoaA/NifB/PqqE/SkfB family radical SAM enzyme